MADAADSGSDWEVVSLTASTYAAAPGPISPLLLPIHGADTPLVPNPAPPSHFFMSQHFNLPAAAGQPLTTHLENSGCQDLKSDPALNMPGPENYHGGERDDVLVASPAGNGLQVEGGGGDELQQTTTPYSLADATDGTTTVGSADVPSLPAHAAPVTGGVAARVHCNAAQAWWEKTFSFPRNNGTEPLAFRFVFVAGKLQLQEDLSPEFGVHGQTQNIGCAVNEPLGQVKGSMLGGGPVAQQG